MKTLIHKLKKQELKKAEYNHTAVKFTTIKGRYFIHKIIFPFNYKGHYQVAKRSEKIASLTDDNYTFGLIDNSLVRQYSQEDTKKRLDIAKNGLSYRIK